MNIMICIVCIFIDVLINLFIHVFICIIHIYMCTCAHMYPVRAGLHIHIIHYVQGSLVYLVASLATVLYPHSSWNNIYIMYILNMTLRWHPWSGFNRSNVGRLGMVFTVKRDDFPLEIMPDDRGDFPAMCHDGWSSWSRLTKVQFSRPGGTLAETWTTVEGQDGYTAHCRSLPGGCIEKYIPSYGNLDGKTLIAPCIVG